MRKRESRESQMRHALGALVHEACKFAQVSKRRLRAIEDPSMTGPKIFELDDQYETARDKVEDAAYHFGVMELRRRRDAKSLNDRG